ncbi:hypothetical protein [Comamonas odontotermitis]|uniref:hypothetical protein n=1 Tax=Comamonas odontotermitis TaxID=379895 RepID=UPI001CC78C55|nr:hypothetical protein [Comamonas odontotermitis]UBB16486.1 hypothetical protein LAD35_17015 [Comamonas odontotermitis]
MDETCTGAWGSLGVGSGGTDFMTWGNYAWLQPAKADMSLQFSKIKAFSQHQEFSLFFSFDRI